MKIQKDFQDKNGYYAALKAILKFSNVHLKMNCGFCFKTYSINWVVNI